jgi:hypothetical protein
LEDWIPQLVEHLPPDWRVAPMPYNRVRISQKGFRAALMLQRNEGYYGQAAFGRVWGRMPGAHYQHYTVHDLNPKPAAVALVAIWQQYFPKWQAAKAAYSNAMVAVIAAHKRAAALLPYLTELSGPGGLVRLTKRRSGRRQGGDISIWGPQATVRGRVLVQPNGRMDLALDVAEGVGTTFLQGLGEAAVNDALANAGYSE